MASEIFISTGRPVIEIRGAANAGGGNVTSVGLSGGITGLTTTGSPITSSGTITLGGVLVAASGGTGHSSYTIGDILVANSATTLTKLQPGALGSTLVSQGAGLMPVWQGVTVTLTGDVTGSGDGTIATTIADNAVTLGKLATIATDSFLGRDSVGVGNVEVISSSAARIILAINNVENTALSTWPGSTFLTTLGSITTGTWNATTIADNKISATLTGKTYNGLTLTALATGWSISGGTISKTLTVLRDITLQGTDGAIISATNTNTLNGGTFSGTNTGDQTSIVGINGTKAQYNTSLQDDDFLFVGSGATNETPSGIINGINTVFITAANFTAGKIRVYLNGLKQRAGIGNDYTETGANQITFTNAPITGDTITVDYI